MKLLKGKLERFRSIRLGSLLHIFLSIVISVLVVSIGTIILCRQQLLNGKKTEVSDYGERLANAIISNGYLSSQSSEMNLELKTAANIFGGRVLIVDSNLKITADTYNSEVGKTLISGDVIECMKGQSTSASNSNDEWMELLVPIKSTVLQENNIVGAVILRASLRNERMTYEKVRNWVIVIALIIMVVAVMISLAITSWIVRPYKRINESLQHISDGYLEDVITIGDYYETKILADSFNEMLEKMRKIEESRQEFVSNVSHELKTPMTSIKVLADSLTMQPDAPVELYREFMTDINDEIDREVQIINDLLSLVRLDQKDGEMHIAQVSINELLEIILKRIKPLAQQRNIELIFESFRPVLAEVDEVKLSLAISNLIENAVKYNVDDGNVRVSLNADHKYFYVTVADSGIGIPEAAQMYIFDRFYRVDKARSRQHGGTGLGLAIAKSAVVRHKGTIKVYSRENEGTTFTVRIPLSYIA